MVQHGVQLSKQLWVMIIILLLQSTWVQFSKGGNLANQVCSKPKTGPFYFRKDNLYSVKKWSLDEKVHLVYKGIVSVSPCVTRIVLRFTCWLFILKSFSIHFTSASLTVLRYILMFSCLLKESFWKLLLLSASKTQFFEDNNCTGYVAS